MGGRNGLFWGVFWAVLVVMGSGCTTSLTNMAPARTFEAGQGQAAVGYQFDVHTQSFTAVYRAGEAVVDEIRGISDDEFIEEETLRRLLDVALLLQLFPIGGAPEVQARLGVWDGLLEGVDIGFRTNGNVYKGDVRVQLFESADEAFAISAQMGYGYNKSVVRTLVTWVTLTDFKRHDLDWQLNFGYELGDWARFYISPRYLYSRVSTEASLADFLQRRLPERIREWDPNQYFPATALHYVGLNWGMMFGYRYAFFNLDVSAFRVLFRPEVLGSVRDYDGWVLAPTLGVNLRW